MRKVGLIQSNYLPWRGYFDFINSVDLFIFYDDIQYTKRDWRNRNLLKTQEGTKWISVPVQYHHAFQQIGETRIDYSKNWISSHINMYKRNYKDCEFYLDGLSILEKGLSQNSVTISELNIILIRIICEYLSIKTEMKQSSEYGCSGTKTERIIQLLKKVDASGYVSGPSAEDYLDVSLFRENGIGLEFKTYEYPPYTQQWGEFVNGVSIIDLIANMGPSSGNLITSTTPNQIIC